MYYTKNLDGYTYSQKLKETKYSFNLDQNNLVIGIN